MPLHDPSASAPRRAPSASSSVRLVGWLCALAPILLTLSVACHRNESSASDAKPAASVPPVARGSHVIVERTAGNFMEATVLEEQGEHLRLQSADGSQSLRASKTSVYSLSPPVTEATPGEFAICSVQRLVWKGCTILSAQANEISVVTAQAEQYRLSRPKVLRASELTRMNVKQTFAKAERRAQFLRELNQAGVPLAPPGWRPGPRERVIAKRQNDRSEEHTSELQSQ